MMNLLKIVACLLLINVDNSVAMFNLFSAAPAVLSTLSEYAVDETTKTCVVGLSCVCVVAFMGKLAWDNECKKGEDFYAETRGWKQGPVISEEQMRAAVINIFTKEFSRLNKKRKYWLVKH